ncbi:hypothetical protein L243_38585, partial [Salmonella enterica subsp. enterica serovar Worthington str. BCH-3008]
GLIINLDIQCFTGRNSDRGDVLKNLQAILNIHRHVIQNISPVTITAGKTLDIKIDNQSHILLITKGAIKVCRRIDSIVMGCGVSPMILGLVDAYADLYQLEENSDVFLSAIS